MARREEDGKNDLLTFQCVNMFHLRAAAFSARICWISITDWLSVERLKRARRAASAKVIFVWRRRRRGWLKSKSFCPRAWRVGWKARSEKGGPGLPAARRIITKTRGDFPFFFLAQLNCVDRLRTKFDFTLSTHWWIQLMYDLSKSNAFCWLRIFYSPQKFCSIKNLFLFQK